MGQGGSHWDGVEVMQNFHNLLQISLHFLLSNQLKTLSFHNASLENKLTLFFCYLFWYNFIIVLHLANCLDFITQSFIAHENTWHQSGKIITFTHIFLMYIWIFLQSRHIKKKKKKRLGSFSFADNLTQAFLVDEDASILRASEILNFSLKLWELFLPPEFLGSHIL